MQMGKSVLIEGIRPTRGHAHIPAWRKRSVPTVSFAISLFLNWIVRIDMLSTFSFPTYSASQLFAYGAIGLIVYVRLLYCCLTYDR